MKTISEVCKLVGVTRKTLRGYDEVELLKPTAKSDGGNHNWLYDDDAVKRLFLIQTFVEAGYERKELKDILESPSLDIIMEYDRVIERLKEKRKRIDGMISSLETMKYAVSLPTSVMMTMNSMDITRLYHDKSFMDHLNEFVALAAYASEEEQKEVEFYTPIMYLLVVIGCLQDQAPDSAAVQECVKEYNNLFFKMTLADNDGKEQKVSEKYSSAEVAEQSFSFAKEMLDAETTTFLEAEYGRGTVDFILRALKVFGEAQYD